jgi:patatin-like phospholipase/acyl hydrolase
MSDEAGELPPKRSDSALRQRRKPLPWPQHRDFRILSIDGGGIRGIYPAAFLAGLEQRYLGGASVGRYFDLIAGTSTGGIIALALAAELTGASLLELYARRGCEIFPPVGGRFFSAIERVVKDFRQFFKFRYDREALTRILDENLGARKFGEAKTRLCIPSFDGSHGDVYIFKTPHHPDFKQDARESMVKVGLATAAAPTFYQPLQEGGYTFVDGGVWANNPIMIALVDVLSCFDVPRERIRILSLGCGDDPYTVDKPKIMKGGALAWRDIIYAAMRLQSLNALGQAGLLIGPEQVIRIDAPASEKKIHMDDWVRATAELPAMAQEALDTYGNVVARMFLSDTVAPYEPVRSIA